MTAMRIIDLQRRLREVGRIRTGDTTTADNGKTRPRKLERFRLTSRDRKVIDVAAATWGGAVTDWAAPDGPQWQVYIEADELTVIVPPGDMSFSQSYEQWSAGGCQVRCDGAWDHLADRACHCDPSDRDCGIHTRLSVIVPDLPGIGVWRLETHSYYAAVELGGLVDLCAAQAAAGVMIPARLRLEQRSVKRIDAKSGKVQTRRFAVPVLDLDVNPLALGAGGTAVAGQLASGPVDMTALAGPSITPVPEPERVLRPSVAEQVGAVNDDRPTRERRQAAVPRTGLKPRTAEQAACSVCGDPYTDGRPVRRGRDGESGYVHTEHDDKDAPGGGEGSGVSGGREASDANVTVPPGADRVDMGSTPEPDPAKDDAGRPPELVTARKLATRSQVVFADHVEVGPRGGKSYRTVDRLRHALVHAQTGGAKASAGDCDGGGLLRVWQRLDDLAEGRMTYELEVEAGVTWVTGSGKRVTVMWTEIEDDPKPGVAG